MSLIHRMNLKTWPIGRFKIPSLQIPHLEKMIVFPQETIKVYDTEISETQALRGKTQTFQNQSFKTEYSVKFHCIC